LGKSNNPESVIVGEKGKIVIHEEHRGGKGPEGKLQLVSFHLGKSERRNLNHQIEEDNIDRKVARVPGGKDVPKEKRPA